MGVEPGLNRDEREHAEDPNNEIEVCEIGTNDTRQILERNKKLRLEVKHTKDCC
jgi:hypothetical protein